MSKSQQIINYTSSAEFKKLCKIHGFIFMGKMGAKINLPLISAALCGTPYINTMYIIYTSVRGYTYVFIDVMVDDGLIYELHDSYVTVYPRSWLFKTSEYDNFCQCENTTITQNQLHLTYKNLILYNNQVFESNIYDDFHFCMNDNKTILALDYYEHMLYITKDYKLKYCTIMHLKKSVLLKLLLDYNIPLCIKFPQPVYRYIFKTKYLKLYTDLNITVRNFIIFIL